MLECWLGLGLLTSKGSKWFHRRKMLTPTFHFQIMKEFLPIFNKHSAQLVDKLHGVIAEMGSDSKTPIDMVNYLTLTTLDSICGMSMSIYDYWVVVLNAINRMRYADVETAMGKEVNALHRPNHPYITALNRFGELLSKRFTSGKMWYRFDPAWFNLATLGREQRRQLDIMHKFTLEVD